MEYEDVWLEASDGTKLHSWFIKYTPDMKNGELRIPRNLQIPGFRGICGISCPSISALSLWYCTPGT